MNNLLGATEIKIELFKTPMDFEVNNFLKEHNGNIIDIQISAAEHGQTCIMVVYKKQTERK